MNTFRLNKLKESGQLDKYWLQWKPQARKDCLASQNIDPIKIQIVVSLFIMLGAFVIISLAIYIIEVLMKKKIVRSNSAMEAKDSFNNVTSMRAFTQNKCTFKENQSNLRFFKESARRSNGRKIKTQQKGQRGKFSKMTEEQREKRRHGSALQALKNLEVELFLDLTLRRIPETEL